MTDPMTWTSPPKVLAVDDEAVVCESVRRVLSDEGYDVTTTTSAREGLQLIRTQQYDLLLLDIMMPDIRGIEFLRVARDISPDTEVLIVTGYATIETAVEAIKLGAFDYLEKPVSPPQLMVSAARALERRQLLDLTRRLREELESRHKVGNVICSSSGMRKVMQLVGKVAPTASTVLIQGETGTGKELIARAIHYNSPRKNDPFVVADCASLTETLLESELFGHVRGAFTGAVKDRKGLVEAARGGTLLLDEIATISPSVQGSLLRLIQEREIRPVGGDRSIAVDVRIIAATHTDLRELVEQGTFREDLLYRLNVFAIDIPPLRERREEIAPLTYEFIQQISDEFGKQIDGISPRALAALELYDWPGNVRELQHVVERAILLADGPIIDADDIPSTVGDDADEDWSGIPDTAEGLVAAKKLLREQSVVKLEKQFLLKALSAHDWNVTRTAEAVGMQRPNLHALIRKHGITGPKPMEDDGSEPDEGTSQAP